MTVGKLHVSTGFALLLGASSSLPAQVPGSPPVCEVHVWQSKFFASDNSNAVGGLVGAVVEGIVDQSAPPNTVREQMAQNLEDQNLATIVRSLDWSRYVGTRSVSVTIESNTIDERALSALERQQTRNPPSNSACHIELYVGKQTFQGGMKTWLFSKLWVRAFDVGRYRAGHGIVFTHVKHFPAKSAAEYPAAIDEIRGGFARNLMKFLDKKLAIGT